MKKIVINKDFGGFQLSAEAMVKLIKCNCKAVKTMTLFEYTGGDNVLPRDKFKTVGDGYQSGWVEDVLHKDGMVYAYQDEVRDDPDLIRIVEEMGSNASASVASLGVIEIPDGIEYEIEEYDGSEWVSEKHRTWR